MAELPDIEAVTMAANMSKDIVLAQQEEIRRLRRIENAALRVASSRRLHPFSRLRIVDDQGVLDRLDAALEGREHICSCGLRIDGEKVDGGF